MARAGAVATRVAHVAHYQPITVDRMLRNLRAAKLVPTGKRGLGKVDGAYQASDLANLVLAFAGPQPSDAVDAAAVLRPLIHIPLDGELLPNPPNTLGKDLESWIEGFALGLTLDDLSEAKELPRVIELSLTRLGARVVYTDRVDLYFTAAGWDQKTNANQQWLMSAAGVEKPTHVFAELIAECGRLFLDTMQHQKASIQASSDSLEKQTAVPPARGAAAVTGTRRVPALSSPCKEKERGPYSTAPARSENPQRIQPYIG